MSLEQATADLLPRRLVSKRYGDTVRTIVRWESIASMRFPEPIVIRNRRYYSAAALTDWDRANASRLTAAA